MLALVLFCIVAAYLWAFLFSIVLDRNTHRRDSVFLALVMIYALVALALICAAVALAERA